ncbi:2,3-bisphosphoglycerate-independent phosphoglycerate mutase [Frankliniella fusca]|uniref:2,3-bisphosphoglycerate-independent phosphoglycerate mutase n=1 Tax=Frankliniella fusca TaxID=407009 RepID=A0AAE1H6F6_9NEOP|nr:2,3-bisphosphoglycerate-independent phosphoglycerate mutase [Frankliniella fusca]
MEYFRGLQETIDPSEKEQLTMASIDQDISEIQMDIVDTVGTRAEVEAGTITDKIVDLEPLKELQSELERLYKIDNSSFTIKQVKALTERLKRVKDEGQVCKTMGAIANALNPRRHKKGVHPYTTPSNQQEKRGSSKRCASHCCRETKIH